jgi:cytochrome c oxidase subunit 1
MNETLGKIHFWLSFVFMNGVFMPMFIMGLAGVSRRLYNPVEYAHALPTQPLNVFSSWSAWLLALAQIPFFINFIGSLFRGKKTVDNNPWQATTLEWAAPSPPPHGNFAEEPVVYRGPYEYSVPGKKADFSPQFVKEPV